MKPRAAVMLSRLRMLRTLRFSPKAAIRKEPRNRDIMAYMGKC